MKWLYIGLVIWTLLPLILFFLLPGIAALFKNKRIQIFFRKLLALLLGLKSGSSNMTYLYQFGNLECGEISLRNVFIALNKNIECDFRLPENSSMRDIHEAAIQNNLSTQGQKNVSLNEVRESLQNTNIKIMALMKVFYPFNGFWIYPTRLFMKLLTSNTDALHWVVIDHITDRAVFIIDPYFGHIEISNKNFLDVWNNVIIKLKTESE